jgi:hypothetical protein
VSDESRIRRAEAIEAVLAKANPNQHESVTRGGGQ